MRKGQMTKGEVAEYQRELDSFKGAVKVETIAPKMILIRCAGDEFFVDSRREVYWFLKGLSISRRLGR